MGYAQSDLYSIESINYARRIDIPVINKAIEYFIKENYVAARETLNKLPKKLYFNNPGYLYLIANCSFNLREYNTAITQYSLTPYADPTAIRVYFFRGLSLLEKKIPG